MMLGTRPKRFQVQFLVDEMFGHGFIQIACFRGKFLRKAVMVVFSDTGGIEIYRVAKDQQLP